ncbi:hypothetical protein Hanom_Chr14g01300331 [Helianthus anomalus]
MVLHNQPVVIPTESKKEINRDHLLHSIYSLATSELVNQEKKYLIHSFCLSSSPIKSLAVAPPYINSKFVFTYYSLHSILKL